MPASCISTCKARQHSEKARPSSCAQPTCVRKAQDAAEAVAGEVALAAAALAARGGALLVVPPAQRLDGAAQHDDLVSRQGGEVGRVGATCWLGHGVAMANSGRQWSTAGFSNLLARWVGRCDSGGTKVAETPAHHTSHGHQLPHKCPERGLPTSRAVSPSTCCPANPLAAAQRSFTTLRSRRADGFERCGDR